MIDEKEADTSTDVLAAEAPAESEQPKSVPDTEPENETEKPSDEAPAEKAEGDESEEEEKPKRRSGYDRMKRRALIAEAELANLRGTDRQPSAAKDDGEKPPKEEDFNGDWGAYIAARAAYEAGKAVEGRLTAREQAAAKSREADLRREALEDFDERANEFRKSAKDFDQVIGKFIEGGGKLEPHVRDLVIDSDEGAKLAYFLAKNPSKAAEINALPPLKAAKEIGALELSLSRPATKPTQAPKPVAPVKGGASVPASQDARLDAWLKKQYG